MNLARNVSGRPEMILTPCVSKEKAVCLGMDQVPGSVRINRAAPFVLSFRE